MNKTSLFISVVSGFGLFTILSIDVLRQTYGQNALLVVYGITAILMAIAVYSFVEKISKNLQERKENQDNNDSEQESDASDDGETSDEEEDIVDNEMKNLKNKNS